MAGALAHVQRGSLAGLARDLRGMVTEARERRAVRRRPLPPTPPAVDPGVAIS